MKKSYFLFLLTLLPLLASADAIQINGIYYNLNAEGQTAEVTRNPNRYSGDIIIPESVTYEEVTYSVTSIGEFAFDGCIGLTSVTIPNSVTSIKFSAFYKVPNLTSVNIPNSVTSIGSSAFEGCISLTSISIPNSVTSIGDYAFWFCGLTSVTIPNNVTSIGKGVFGKCRLTSINVEADNTVYDSRDDCNAIVETASNILISGCKTTIIPNSVTSIGQYAFSECNSLTSLTIPNSVISLGQYAFWGCSSLTSMTIPNSVTSIETGAFLDCSSLASITIPPSVTSIGDKIFRGCSRLASIVVEAGNTVYDSRNDCNAIVETASNTLIAGCKTTVIPNSVTSIATGAFQDCSGLTFVTIPNSVTSIGALAFQNCSGLTSVTIPNSVISIGDDAFSSCDGLTSVTSLATTPPQADENSFSNYDIPLNVPKGTRDGYLAASPWNKFKEIIEIDNTDVDEITIKDIGKTTWCSENDLDFTSVAGIKAYTATGYDDIDKTIWLTRVMKVPAGTGILVKGDAGTYKIPHSTVRAIYANFFKGNLGEAIKIEETDGDKTNYYLSGKDGTFVSVNGNANIGKNKAYLQLPTSVFAGTRSIGINYDDEDGTTGINVQSSMFNVQSDAYYTLQGQRVLNPGKGLYIHNGKKVVIK